jgi:hypothetical protein
MGARGKIWSEDCTSLRSVIGDRVSDIVFPSLMQQSSDPYFIKNLEGQKMLEINYRKSISIASFHQKLSAQRLALHRTVLGFATQSIAYATVPRASACYA